MQISVIKANRIKAELKELEAMLQQDSEDIKKAREKRDLSENTEYDAAMKARQEHQTRYDELMEILAKSTIATPTNTIGVGTLLRILEVEETGVPVEGAEERLLLVEERGDTITEGVLNTNSALGRAIFNKSSGSYSISQGGNKYHYRVMVDETAEGLREYSDMYPLAKKEWFERIFSKEG